MKYSDPGGAVKERNACNIGNVHKLPRYLSVRTLIGKTGYTLVLSATS